MTDCIPSRPDGEPIPCRGCQYFTGPGCGCDNAGHDRPQNPGPRPGLDQISSDDLDTLYERAENAEAELEQVRQRLMKAKRAADLLADSHQCAERAEAAIERVRRIHRPTEGLGYDSDEDDTPGSYGVIAQACSTCGTADEYATRWPCATIRALDEHQEQAGPAEQPAEETPDRLTHVGWWCWRGNNHGHLTTQACKSDNVPLHAPTEWADDMRAVIQRIEDGDDEHQEQP